jgi:hypothetical protein
MQAGTSAKYVEIASSVLNVTSELPPRQIYHRTTSSARPLEQGDLRSVLRGCREGFTDPPRQLAEV